MRPYKTALFIFLLVLSACSPVLSQPVEDLNGRVVRVSDGDSLWIESADRFEWLQVRLYGIDAPESEWPGMWPAQPYSDEAKKYLVERVAGRQVSVRLKDIDTYGRAVGEVFLDGRSLSRELIQSGLAWWNRKYAPADADLRYLQEKAKTAKLGLWAQENPTAPWEHRRKYRAE